MGSQLSATEQVYFDWLMHENPSYQFALQSFLAMANVAGRINDNPVGFYIDFEVENPTDLITIQLPSYLIADLVLPEYDCCIGFVFYFMPIGQVKNQVPYFLDVGLIPHELAFQFDTLAALLNQKMKK